MKKKAEDNKPELLARPDKRRAASDASSPEKSRGSSSTRWTFLTNHAHVLACLHMQPDMVLREVATRVGVTERAVQRIVHELEEDGFISREKVGRRNHYVVVVNRPLRHPIEAHRNIGDLLTLISTEE